MFNKKRRFGYKQGAAVKQGAAISRREAMKRAGMIGAGLAIVGPGVLILEGCGPKVSFYISTMKGALIELKPLLPSAGSLIDKAIAVAATFDAAWRAGKFANAITVFQELAGVISQIANDVNISTPQVKAIVSIAGIALRAIAAILDSQRQEPAVAQMVKRSIAKPSIKLIDILGGEVAIDQIFAVVKP